jgi:hypothetical protein
MGLLDNNMTAADTAPRAIARGLNIWRVRMLKVRFEFGELIMGSTS